MKNQVGLFDCFISPSSGRTYLDQNYILVGNPSGYSQQSPALIDLRLDLINTDAMLASAKLIVQSPISGLDSAQALNSLTDGILKNVGGVLQIATGSDYPPVDATYIINVPNPSLTSAQDVESLLPILPDGNAVMIKAVTGGLLARAIPDTDYATLSTLEKLRDEAQKSADEAANSATEAANSATEAANSATEAANSATEAATSETNAANSATAAHTSEINASNSASTAQYFADNAGLAAGDADAYAGQANDAMVEARKAAASANAAAGVASSSAGVAVGSAGAAAGSAAAALGAASSASSSSSSASGSASAASSSASAAATSASNASASASSASTFSSNASSSATAAAGSASSAASSLSTFLSTNLNIAGAVIGSNTVNNPISVVFQDNAVFPGTAGITVPQGTTAQRLGGAGTVRLNTTLGVFEGTTDGSTWATFDTAGGTVTSIATGTGLTGGPITTSGTISIATTGVTAGSYTFGNFTVNAQGQLTAASSNTPVTSLVAGTGINVSSATGDVTVSIANTAVSAGSYTYPNITINAQGQLTAASNGDAPVLIAGSTMSGALILNGDPSSPLGAATKQYVDAISQGLFFKSICYATTTANLTTTYSNGTAGVGATLTNSGTLAAFSIDGVSPALNARILVKNQTSQFQNGIYTLTTVGSGSIAYVLTRASDYDQTAEIQAGDIIPIEYGTVNSGTSWLQIDIVATIGTDPIAFNQYTYNQNQFLQCANNLSDLTNAATARTNLGVSTTNHCVLIGNSFGSITSIANPAGSNNVLVSNAGTDPAWTTYLIGLTQVGVGNLVLQTNTIYSANVNGDIYIDPNGTGKVGINTVTPTSRLHVRDDLASGSFSAAGFFAAENETYPNYNGISAGFDDSNGWSWIYSRSVAQVGGAVTSKPLAIGSGATPCLWIAGSSSSTGMIGVNDKAPGTTISVVGNAQVGFASGTTAPSGGFASAGDTGVGTNAPASRFHVVKGLSYPFGDYGVFTADTAASGGSGLSMGYDTTNNWTWVNSRTAGSTLRTLNINNCLYIGTSGNNAVSIGTPTIISNVLNIAGGLATGSDAGIGTTSPQSRLHVVKGFSYALGNYGLFTADTAASGGSGISVGYDTANNWSWIFSRTVGSTGRALNLNNSVYISGSGSTCVGIGKQAPTYALHLGTDNATPYLYMASSPTPATSFSDQDGIYSVYVGSPKFTSFTSGGAAGLYNGTILTTNSYNSGNATLNGTTGVTISSPIVNLGSVILATYNISNGTSLSGVGTLVVGGIINGTSFKIYSTNSSDTNDVSWHIIQP